MKKIVVKKRSTLIIIMCAWCHVFNTYHFYSMGEGLGAKSIDRFLQVWARSPIVTLCLQLPQTTRLRFSAGDAGSSSDELTMADSGEWHVDEGFGTSGKGHVLSLLLSGQNSLIFSKGTTASRQ